MCEFCNDPSQKNNRDAQHPDFAGFFSVGAIDAAVREANAYRESNPDDDPDGDDDSDGT
jgi:hypothetical protein